MGFSYVDLRGLRAPLLPAGDHLPEVPVTRQAGTGFPFFQDHVSGHILVGSQQVHLIRDIRCSSSRGWIRNITNFVDRAIVGVRYLQDLRAVVSEDLTSLVISGQDGVRCHHRESNERQYGGHGKQKLFHKHCF